MEKNEYVFRLRAGLGTYPEPMKKEIMESFENYYEEERRKGKKTLIFWNRSGIRKTF